MLGLADRARIVDLFQHIVKGDVAAALDEFAGQYEAGASPSVVLTDLADFTHLVTRLKYVPDAASDQSLSEIERTRGAEFSSSIAVTTLSRIWQMLLKGIPETESSSRPAGAAEMVLIRLAHAAHLPAPEEAARRLLELSSGDAPRQPSAPNGGNGGGVQASMGGSVQARGNDMPPAQRATGNGATMLRAVPDVAPPQAMPVGQIEERPAEAPVAKAEPRVPLRSVSDIADLCGTNRDIKLKTLVRGFVRLVNLEPGRLEINLPEDAPKTLVAELQKKLEDWTGIRWMVILSREPGAPTLLEAETRAQEKRLSDARQDPDVAAILAKFPGAKITDVRIKGPELEEENEPVTVAAAESEEGDILPGDDIEH
jgi:DNA polymerase-3 subunit gamma/tau